jgi:23S rRNA-/tRNA-specific pseudouridylate synthase
LDVNFTKNQLTNFTKEQEYGLLNRLDNDTSGFLYFAKNNNIFSEFKTLQKQEKVNKIYYAKVT